MKIFALVGLLLLAPALQAQTAAARSDPPPRLVSVEEGLDTAATIRALQAISYSPQTPAAWLFRVYYSATSGAVDSVVHEKPERLPAGASQSVRAILRRTARTIEPRDSAGVLAVVVLPGDHAIDRAPLEQRPVLLNTREAGRTIRRFARAFVDERPEWKGHAPVVVVVRMRIDSAGIPSGVTLVRRGVYAVFDAEALRRAATLRFQPAQLEGEPVALLVQQPFTYTFK